MLLGLHGFLDAASPALARAVWRRMAVPVAGQRLLHALWRGAGRHVAGVLLFEPGRVAGAAGDPRHLGRVEPAARPDHVEVSRRARPLRAAPVAGRARGLQRAAALVGAGVELCRGSGVGVLREDAHNLFPGVTAARSCCWRSSSGSRAEDVVARSEVASRGGSFASDSASRPPRALLAMLAMLVVGPWRVTLAGAHNSDGGSQSRALRRDARAGGLLAS